MKDQLVQYQGGSYDSCLWEWNYAAVIGGTLHDIYQSGRKRFSNPEELARYIEQKDGDGTYVYPFTKEALGEFASSSNPGHVIGVAQYLLRFGVEVWAKCEVCGEELLAADLIPGGLASCGGIAMQYNNMRCKECHLERLCPLCGYEHDTLEEAMDCCEEES